jgi:hypothetical protein
MTRHRTLALAGLLATVIAGCGGGAEAPSDQQQVTTTVRSFLQSLSVGDSRGSCAQLTAGARRGLVALVAQRARSIGAAPATCEDAVALTRVALPASTLTAIRGARVANVVVRGGGATCKVVDGDAFPAQRVTLAKSPERWQISNVPTLVGG